METASSTLFASGVINSKATKADMSLEPLPSLDLFTGVGGITLALHGIASPVAYCDVAPESIANLERNMKLGNIPRAPISTDVRQLDRRWLAANSKGRAPKAVVAGFPCVGFSSMGRRKGFSDQQSSLFAEVLRIVDEFRVPLVFLENVPNILNLGMQAVVRELARKRGFELRWCVLGASDVGAPHKRRRWFCLCVRPGFQFKASGMAYRPFRWDVPYDPARRMRCVSDAQRKDDSLRMGLMGNSVVPDAVRMAFFFLASMFDKDARPDARELSFAALGGALATLPASTVRAHGWPRCGAALPNGRVLVAQPPTEANKYVLSKRAHSATRIVLVPSAFRPTKPPSKLLALPVLKSPKTMAYWSTPRHGITSTTNYITERTAKDLQTQVRFEKATPDSLRGCSVHPGFTEWLMGYPRDWTRLT